MGTQWNCSLYVLTQYIKEQGSPLHCKSLPRKQQLGQRLTLCLLRAINAIIAACNAINLPNYFKGFKGERYYYLLMRWKTHLVSLNEDDQWKSGCSGGLWIALAGCLEYMVWGAEMGRADEIPVKLTCCFPRKCVGAQPCCGFALVLWVCAGVGAEGTSLSWAGWLRPRFDFQRPGENCVKLTSFKLL